MLQGESGKPVNHITDIFGELLAEQIVVYTVATSELNALGTN